MKGNITKWKLLLMCMLLPSCLMAQQKVVEKELILLEMQADKKLIPIKEKSLKPSIKMAEARRAQTRTTASDTLTMNDLLGLWIVQSPSLVPNQIPDAGNSVTITKVDEKTILIKNFWDAGIELKATVDFEQKTIAIPYQKAFVNSTYGDCDIRWITVVNGQLQGSKTKAIMGTISADGIELTDYWGMFITSGTNADEIFGVYGGTTFQRGNAMMTTDERDGTHIEYPVVLTQKSDNLLTVLNFANFGKTIEVALNEDQSFSIASQVAYKNNQYGDFYTYAANWEANTIEAFIRGTGDEHTLNWGAWLIQSEKVYLGNHVNGKITTDVTIKYPKLSIDKFEGEGTEANPYLIKGKDEFVLLSQRVNKDKELIYGSGNKHTKTYLGKFFKVVNDIDLTAIRLDPIGDAWSQCFAGTFDGNGKIITGLNVSTSSGFGGLFGRVDTAGVIKNVKLEKVNIQSNGRWTGGLVAWCLGDIVNCHVTGTVSNRDKETGGIAGGATNITSCTFSGTVIGLNGCVGGIVGQASGSVSNSFSDAIVAASSGSSATESCGGIVGALYLEKASVSNCYFAGTVTASGQKSLYLGGIVGNCYKGNISQCYNVGIVANGGYSGATGGIAGYLIGTITNCYNSGHVTQPACKSVGGITGGINDNRHIMTGELVAHTAIKNCYTVGTVMAETSAYNPETETRETIGTIQQTALPIIENVYYDKQMLNFGSKKYGLLTGELISGEGPKGFSKDAWVFAEGYYPRLKGMETGIIADLSASAILLDVVTPDNVYKVTKDFSIKLAGDCKAGFYLDEGNGQGSLRAKGHAASLQKGNIVQLTGNGKDTLFIANGAYTRSYVITVTSSSVFEGEGTEAKPFLIKNKEDMIKLSELTGPNLKQYYRDTYFKMTNDIDLEYDEAFTGINVDLKDANHQFLGHFNGGGYTIHRMKLTGVVWKTTPEEAKDGWGIPDNTAGSPYLGFIGRLGTEGSISNLNIANDCKLEFWGMSGAIVGVNYGGLIESCKNYADITAYSSGVGGICGTNDRLGAGIIRNCYNAGTIKSGYNTAAGIVGTNAGTVENCQNDGTIIIEKLSTFQATSVHAGAGGIIGTLNAAEKIALRNNLNTGMIIAKKRVGGICGMISISGTNSDVDMANNINYGTLFTEDVISRGGFCGEFSATCKYTMSANYYDSQLLPYGGVANATAEGVIGVETSVLTQDTLENFSADIWKIGENRYPVLKAFAAEEKATIASLIIVKIASKETTGNLRSDLTLSAPEGVSWSLKQNKAFTLNGTNIKIAESVDEVAYDTLIATSAVVTKTIILAKLPEVPLAGKGTTATPYLINNANDWNALSKYISDTYQNMEGKYIQIVADINFQDQAFTPMGGDGITSFEGTMDGNKKTLSNIIFNNTSLEYLGLFGRIGEKGSVSDLTIGSGSFSSTKARIGGFAGKLAGTMKNCVNRSNVSTTSNYAGGIAAFIEANAQLTNCINYGEVNAKTGYAAGIAAECETGASFTHCGNEGKLIGTNTIGGVVAKATGGIFNQCYNKGILETSGSTIGGIIATTAGKDTVVIKNSYNTADIKATNTAAGIVASSKTTPCIIDYCYNEGSVTTTATATTTGTAGIIGVAAPASTISNSYNTGSITAEKCPYVGGISGFVGVASQEDARIYILKSHNEGAISALGNYGGGICGGMANYMTVDSCYNIGTVEGSYYIGGISSNLGGAYSILSNCWNAGSVTAQKNGVGGLFGTGNYSATVNNCFNTETISSIGKDEKTAYQIGGLAGMSKAIFTHCYNSGRVDGKKQVGGLVGQAFSGSINQTTGEITYGTSFEQCYNAGEVTKLDTLSGNFAGDLSGKTWQYNGIKKLYALNTQPMRSDSISSLISSADLSKLDMGEGWINGDDYTYPILEKCNNDYANVTAAAVITSEEDKLPNITQDFHVGTPNNIVWTSSSTALSINGNNVAVKPNTNEEITLTATIGEVSKDITIKLSTPTGIENTTNGKVLVKEEFYTASGIKLIKKQMERGNIYIVVKTYEDGTTENVKEMY